MHALAPGLTPRSVLEKFAAVQMIDIHLPTTNNRKLMLTRYTEPEPELSLLLKKLKLELPAQPPPKITASAPAPPTPMFAVGTPITECPPPRSGRAQLRHPAPTSGG